MEKINQQKIDALSMASEYMDKLIPSMETVVSEIKGEMKDDTVDFLMQIIDGFNFILEVYNATEDVINGEEVLINNDALEETISSLSNGFSKKDYAKIAEDLEAAIVPFLKVYNEAAKKLVK